MRRPGSTFSDSASSLASDVEACASARDRRVLVILTGGTMAMRPHAETGSLEPCKGYLAAQMRLMPECREAKMPSYDVVEYDPLIDSADMCPSHWAKIAADIADNHEDYDGFVVIMGTDTMAYCASALAFMLEGLAKPVVLTGSMVPFAEAYSDARRNLVVALICAARAGGAAEVCIFFGDKLLRGCRATKVDALALDAYDSPNCAPLAKCGVALNYRADVALPSMAAGNCRALLNCRAFLQMETRVLVARMVPGFDDAALLAAFRAKSLKAAVLELYGTGTAPSSRKSLVAALKLAQENGILVVATTQCKRGGVVLDVYQVGQALMDAGVVSAGDMTTEAVVAKLAYLFGKFHGDVEKVRRLVPVALRGEVSPPHTYLRPFFEDGHQPRSEPANDEDLLAATACRRQSTAPQTPQTAYEPRRPRRAPPRVDAHRRLRDVAFGVALGALVVLAARRWRPS
ncbi:asparaginase-domain-containing protein [Pelagophyceae sp. CCMP2097]|nr:asparaginase-domain-containing protein [Pelagophyceae sp. CCMP2097]